MIRTVLAAAVARAALADLHALAPSAREEHRPAVKRSAERAAKASRLLADHGHLLPPALRQKGQDLLNEHEFRLHVALDSANPGLALAAVEKKESGYLKAFRKLGGDNAVSKARKLPKDDERTKFRATREVLREATGIDAEEPVWGAPFRALEALFGEGHAPMEALGVSAKFFQDGTALTKRYHVALSPPCDCWTFGRAVVVEQAKSVAESLKAPPLVDAWLDAIAADDTGKLPSIGFGVSADDGACKLYVLNFGGHELPTLPLVDSLPPTARKQDRASSVLVSVEWKLGDAKTQLRQYAVEASADDVAVARHTQDERFDGDELVAALDRAFGVKQSEDIAVTAPFEYDKATTPPVAAAPLAKSGLKLKPQDGNINSNAETDAKLAALLKDAAPGAEAWLARSRVVRHAVSNVQFGEGFVTLYRHPTVFGFVDASSAPQHLALRNALAKRTRATRRRLDDMTACDLAEETFMDNAVWGSDESTCARGSDGNDPDKDQCPGMCPASCQKDIEDLIAACDECALADVACDAPVDLGTYPSLASGDLSFEYKAPVVMAGDMDDDCYEYLDENEDEEGLEGQLEDDMQCLDRDQPDFDCWVEDDENSEGTATIGCRGCSPDGTQAGFEFAMEEYFQSLVTDTGGPCSFDAAASLTSLAGATSQVTTKYSDLDIESVPADKIVRMPWGDSGLIDVMSLWGPEGCRYPYYGYLPDAPLCAECSSTYEARKDVLEGIWDGPCNSDDPPGDYDGAPLPDNYPGCGCDCADFLRRDLSTCSSDSCVNVAQEYAPSNTVCSGSDVSWDTTSSADGCADTYGDGSFDSIWGDACLDDDGEVQGASEQCYETRDDYDDPAQCEFEDGDEDGDEDDEDDEDGDEDDWTDGPAGFCDGDEAELGETASREECIDTCDDAGYEAMAWDTISTACYCFIEEWCDCIEETAVDEPDCWCDPEGEGMSESECAAAGCDYYSESRWAWCECDEEAMCTSAGGEWQCEFFGPMAFKGFPPPEEVCDYDDDDDDDDDWMWQNDCRPDYCTSTDGGDGYDCCASMDWGEAATCANGYTPMPPNPTEDDCEYTCCPVDIGTRECAGDHVCEVAGDYGYCTSCEAKFAGDDGLIEYCRNEAGEGFYWDGTHYDNTCQFGHGDEDGDEGDWTDGPAGWCNGGDDRGLGETASREECIGACDEAGYEAMTWDTISTECFCFEWCDCIREYDAEDVDEWCWCGETDDGFEPEDMSESECAAAGCEYEVEDEETWCECDEARCASVGGEWECDAFGPTAFKGFPPPEVCDYDDDDDEDDDEDCDIETSGDRSSSPSDTTNHGTGNGWCYSALDDHVGCAASPGDCWAMCEDEYGDGLVAIDWNDDGDCYCQNDCECMEEVFYSWIYLITRDSRVGALPHECGPDEGEGDDEDEDCGSDATSGSDADVTCSLVINDEITAVYVDGQDVTGSLCGGWPATLRFSSAASLFAISGYDNEGGCQYGGFAMRCTTADGTGPWHGLTADTQNWRATNWVSGSSWTQLGFDDSAWQTPSVGGEPEYGTDLVGGGDTICVEGDFYFRREVDHPTPRPTPRPTLAPGSGSPSFRVTGDLTFEGMTYEAARDNTDVFVAAVADLCGVAASAVTVEISEARRRRRLAEGIMVTYTVGVASANEAQTVMSAISSSSTADVNAAVSKAATDAGVDDDFDGVTTTNVGTPTTTSSGDDGSSDGNGGNGGADAASAGIIGGAVAGVAVLAAIGVGAFLYMRSKASGADSPPLAEVQLVGSADESALPKAVASAPPLMPPPPPTGRNFCSNCGAPIQGSFCSQCGARA